MVKKQFKFGLNFDGRIRKIETYMYMCVQAKKKFGTCKFLEQINKLGMVL
jgi:hypothetical protein